MRVTRGLRAGLLAWCTACGSSYGAAETPPPQADAGPDAGTACPDRIIYVSPSGDDASLGCTKDRPKKSITSAVSYVTTARATGHEIRVCSGTFTEHELIISWPLVLRGKYDCTTWETAAGNQTIILPDAQTTAATKPATLTVTGKDSPITASTVLEGLTIRGGAGRPVGLSIIDGASPLVTKCEAAGGNGVSSFGIYVSGSPEIADCPDIQGGAGTSADDSPGSAAMGIFGGAPYVHGSTLNGGSGTTTGQGPGSTGIRFGSTGDARITLNTIHPGSGSGTNGVIALGIDIQSPAPSGTLSITENIIQHDGPDLPSCTLAMNGCNTIGIRVYASPAGTATARIHRNRIQPSPVNVPVGTTMYGMWAIAATSASATAEVVNNFIHTGVPVTSSVGMAETRGFTVRKGAKVTAAHNTIALGNASGAAMIISEQGTVGTIADNNLIVASSTTPALVRAFALADASAFQSFANNAIVGDIGVLTCAGTFCPLMPEMSVLAAETLLEMRVAGSAKNNKRIASTCTGMDANMPSTCLPMPVCTNAGDCAKSVLESWDTNTFGENALLTGYKLKSGGTCLLANGGKDDLATFGAQDFFGLNRSLPVSVGAHELTCP